MRKPVLCLLFSIFLLVFPQHAFAHFPVTDGNITITLHVDPNDDPIPGQPAHLYFLFNFNNPTKKFSIRDCNCIVTVSEEGKQILQQKLLDKNNPHLSVWGANMPIVFPERDVYVISIKGDPVTLGNFKSFNLSWNFRVDTSGSGLVRPGPSDIQVLLIALVVGLFILAGIGIFFKEQILSADYVDKNKKH